MTRPDEMRQHACRTTPQHGPTKCGDRLVGQRHGTAPTKRHNSLIGQRLLNMAPTEPHDLPLANAMIWRQHKSLYHPLESAQRHQGIFFLLFIYLFYFLYYSLLFLVFSWLCFLAASWFYFVCLVTSHLLFHLCKNKKNKIKKRSTHDGVPFYK